MKFKLNSKSILTTLNIVISPHLTSPEGEGQIPLTTLNIVISPHLASPEGEGQIPLAA